MGRAADQPVGLVLDADVDLDLACRRIVRRQGDEDVLLDLDELLERLGWRGPVLLLDVVDGGVDAVLEAFSSLGRLTPEYSRLLRPAVVRREGRSGAGTPGGAMREPAATTGGRMRPSGHGRAA